jgi:hypothetical protein
MVITHSDHTNEIVCCFATFGAICQWSRHVKRARVIITTKNTTKSIYVHMRESSCSLYPSFVLSFSSINLIGGFLGSKALGKHNAYPSKNKVGLFGDEMERTETSIKFLEQLFTVCHNHESICFSLPLIISHTIAAFCSSLAFVWQCGTRNFLFTACTLSPYAKFGLRC